MDTWWFWLIISVFGYLLMAFIQTGVFAYIANFYMGPRDQNSEMKELDFIEGMLWPLAWVTGYLYVIAWIGYQIRKASWPIPDRIRSFPKTLK